jgi:hypothetical protein
MVIAAKVHSGMFVVDSSIVSHDLQPVQMHAGTSLAGTEVRSGT